MAGLHSEYLINANQACPGHQSLFPALLLERYQEECWFQKRQARRTQGRGEAATVRLPGPGTLEEADGGSLQARAPW